MKERLWEWLKANWKTITTLVVGLVGATIGVTTMI